MANQGRTPVFGKRLNNLIEESKKSQREIAAELGISQASLSFYILGKREPTLSVLVRISNYFNVSTDYLLGTQFWRRIVHDFFRM